MPRRGIVAAARRGPPQAGLIPPGNERFPSPASRLTRLYCPRARWTPSRPRPLVAFVVVALVLNAQFTWWVVYSLRDNRERLDLERAAGRVADDVAALRRGGPPPTRPSGAIAELPPGVIPSPTPPFVEVRVVEEAELPRRQGAPALEPGATIGWVEQDGRPGVRAARSGAAGWRSRSSTRRRRTVGSRRSTPTLQLVERGDVQAGPPAAPPSVAPLDRLVGDARLPPLAGAGATATASGSWASWPRVRLFLAAIVTAVVLLWRVCAARARCERQHQNFVSAVTHELKTPIAGIRLALETVLSGRVDDEGQDALPRQRPDRLGAPRRPRREGARGDPLHRRRPPPAHEPRATSRSSSRRR